MLSRLRVEVSSQAHQLADELLGNQFMHLLKEDLHNIVVGSGLITEADFARALEEYKRSGRSATDTLIGEGLLSERFLTENLAAFFGVPIIDLEHADIDATALEMVPESFAKSRGVVLYEFDRDARRGKLAMLDPEDFATINYLRWYLGIWLDVFITSVGSLKYGLKQYQRKVSEEFSKVVEENLRASMVSGTLDVAKMIESVPIIAILDTIIEHAVILGASDLHFEPFENRFLIRFRIDGIMQEILSLPTEIAPVLVARVKVLANLQIDIHNAPQDGRFRFSLQDQSIDVRVSVIPTFHGEKVEMRLLKGSLRPLSLQELGFSKKDLVNFEKAVKRPHGMILSTGPTGSGKTTTLYSVLGILNTPKVNITTVEDPIEYDIPGVNQTQVNLKSGLTFAAGLRALMRQNPDIIMVGEIRDQETADIAVNAALTGHLLLSTLHTNDAPTAIPRLIDFGVPQFLIASTLNVVIAQRLVRRICSVCISSVPISEELKELTQHQLKSLNSSVAIPGATFVGKGCKTCGFSGYRGQVGLFEVLYVGDAIRELIVKDTPANVIREAARKKEGMTVMFEDGLAKVESGATTLEEVLRVTRE